jgi:hypothetical protein
MAKNLTIRIGGAGEHIGVALLIQTLKSTVEILRSLESELAVSDAPIRWEVVKASMSSPLTLTLAPEPGQRKQTLLGNRIVKTYLRGIRLVEQGPTQPPDFGDNALECTKKLVSTAFQEGASVTFSTPGEPPVTPTEQATAHIEQIVAKARTYHDVTTIEGRLEVIWTHTADSFFIWEVLTNQRVKCYVTPDQLESATKLLRKRVAVTGVVRYRNDKPVSMEVGEIRVLRKDADPERPGTFSAIDITGGTSPEEYVRSMRDD